MRASIAVVVLLVFATLPAGALADDPPDGENGDSPSAAQLAKVNLLADYIVDNADEVNGLETDVAAAQLAVAEQRAAGIGWGALFKLHMLAAVGADVSLLLNGDVEFEFGELKKQYAEQIATYLEEGGAKNFGQLKKAAKANGANKANKKANKNQGGDE